jgi:hypothetical protein
MPLDDLVMLFRAVRTGWWRLGFRPLYPRSGAEAVHRSWHHVYSRGEHVSQTGVFQVRGLEPNPEYFTDIAATAIDG